MIKVHFYDWHTRSLDVENEIGIAGDIIDFLKEHIPHIEFEATDNVADLENNWIFWFSAENEPEAIRQISDTLSSMIKPDSSMLFTVSTGDIGQW